MYDLLPLCWGRSGSRCEDVCLVVGVDVRFRAVALGSNWGPGAKMYDLLPLCLDRTRVPVLGCTIGCRSVGVEVGSRR